MGVTLSVVVPLAPGEDQWPRLLERLGPVRESDSLVLASSEDAPAGFSAGERVGWLVCPSAGRARQMNFAAARASGTHLWFLHADSRVGAAGYRALVDAVGGHPDRFHYFRLRFFGGGPLMRLNEWGANLRSAWLGAPFGDQGFCLSRELFGRLGGYPEDARYGEDHLLVRRARRAGVRLRRVDHAIETSARRYREEGWLRLVASYQWKWITQALRDR